MGNFFDQTARVLASPMPRRKALWTIGSAAAASVLAAFGISPETVGAQAAPTSCSPACKTGQQCCVGPTKAFCVSTANTCCGDTSCGTNQFCCGTDQGATKPFCRTSKKTCCGNTACNQDQVCVNGRCTASKK